MTFLSALQLPRVRHAGCSAAAALYVPPVLQAAETNGSSISGTLSLNLTGLRQTFEGEAASRTALFQTNVSSPALTHCCLHSMACCSARTDAGQAKWAVVMHVCCL
jgi:hypothetical protein